jgi:hypothetical protein
MGEERPETGGTARRAGRPRAVLAGLALLAATRAIWGGPEPRREADPSAPPVGRPVPIAVEGGRARFRFPTAGPGSRVLVVVSALAREDGPFPIRLEAREAPADGLAPAARVADPPALRPTPAPTPGTLPAPTAAIPPPSRDLWMLARDGDPASASNYRAATGRLRAVGTWVQVYVEEPDLGRVADATLRDLVATFDREVFPEAVRRFGPARDVDGDGRFTILLSGRLAGGPSQRGVDGFVRAADFDPSLPPPFGNRADVLYLDAGLAAGPYLRTVLAHEYAHAVTFSRRLDAAGAPGRPACDEEGWIEEGTAHLVEDIHRYSGSNIDYRVSAFLSAPERYRLVVRDYYAADLFRSHGNRGSTYLFLRWCSDRLGPGFLPAVVRSPECGLANLESASGARFEDLYRRWSVGLYLDALGPPEPGRWLEAGPRAREVEPGGAPEVWSAEGTSSHFARVRGSATGAVEVEVEGPPGAGLQVTAVRLPDDLPELAVAARLVGDGGSARLDLEVAERAGRPLRLEAVGWEPLVPRRGPSEPGFRRGGLQGEALLAAFGACDLAGAGTSRARAIPLPGASEADGPLVVKVVGVDERGRRVAGWAEVDWPAAGR